MLTFSHTYFFSFGGSNSISSIDLSNAYNGITNYHMLPVAILLFAANWTGAIWWCSAACNLVPRNVPDSGKPLTFDKGNCGSKGAPRSAPREGLPVEGRLKSPWLTYLSTMSTFMASGVLIVMILCTVQRNDPSVWTIWGSKYLYSAFWELEWHFIVSLGLSSGLRALGRLS